ncbi:MAG: PAS domain S-box protein [Dehalococcoidia bacterium]|nr:PAS domain S-box protein [Dehalococcoidia bacterium]
MSQMLEMEQPAAKPAATAGESKQSRELFRALFHRSPIGTYIVQNGHFRLVNRQLAYILGYEEDELTGRPSLGYVLTEDRDIVRENAVRMLKGECAQGYEFRIITKQAKIKWVMETVAPVMYQRKRATLGSLIDVTERKLVEERLRQSTLEIQRSNAELEQFAYVISHDLQEPLRMVASYTQLLAKRYANQLDGDADEFISYAVDGAKRMQTLLHELLDYSRVGTRGKPFSLVNCEHVVDQAMANLKIAIEECGATVSYEVLPTVMGDEGQLVRLFQNLIGNAIKFRREEPPHVYISALRRQNVVTFSVKDNGIGIDPQHSQSVFEIFRRLHTKEEYPGTGMGLAICKKIVERHGGHISVQSQPGQGSTFHFTINMAGGEPA